MKKISLRWVLYISFRDAVNRKSTGCSLFRGKKTEANSAARFVVLRNWFFAAASAAGDGGKEMKGEEVSRGITRCFL